MLFADEQREINLLELTNYSEPVWFGEVMSGTYTKIRLQLDEIELFPKGGEPFFIEKLPANGKVDLLHPDGFNVLPGRELMIEIDVDANKSIKITNAGKSGKVNFRPVVRVNVYDTGMPAKLARIEGAVTGEPVETNGTGTFVVCSVDAPDHCVDVATDGETSFFDDVGLESSFGGLTEGNMVVVIGEYATDPFILNAVVVENGGTAEQFTGNVATEPDGDRFLILTVQGEDYIVALQPTTKYYDVSGPISADLIAFGDRVEVEGVIAPKTDPEDPDEQEVIRPALVFLEAYDEQLNGTIVALTLNPTARSFDLITEALDTVCIRVAPEEEASILLVDTTNSIVTPGDFGDLADDQAVDLFGTTAEDACFDANEVIVDVTPPPSE